MRWLALHVGSPAFADAAFAAQLPYATFPNGSPRACARFAPGLCPRLPAGAASPLPFHCTSGRASPGSAGVPPAFFFLQTASHPRHSLAKRTETAFKGISSIVPGLVRAGRPRSQVVFTLSPFPTHGESLSNLPQRLRGPSSSFVFLRGSLFSQIPRPGSQVLAPHSRLTGTPGGGWQIPIRSFAPRCRRRSGPDP